MDEALGLAIGFWCVGFGADMLHLEYLASCGEGEGLVAGAVVGHHPFDPDAEALVVGDGGFEEGNGAALLLVFLIWLKAIRELSSMATWANSQPAPWLRQFWRVPVTRCPACAKRPSFLMSMWIISPGRWRS